MTRIKKGLIWRFSKVWMGASLRPLRSASLRFAVFDSKKAQRSDRTIRQRASEWSPSYGGRYARFSNIIGLCLAVALLKSQPQMDPS